MHRIASHRLVPPTTPHASRSFLQHRPPLGCPRARYFHSGCHSQRGLHRARLDRARTRKSGLSELGRPRRLAWLASPSWYPKWRIFEHLARHSSALKKHASLGSCWSERARGRPLGVKIGFQNMTAMKAVFFLGRKMRVSGSRMSHLAPQFGPAGRPRQPGQPGPGRLCQPSPTPAAPLRLLCVWCSGPTTSVVILQAI